MTTSPDDMSPINTIIGLIRFYIFFVVIYSLYKVLYITMCKIDEWFNKCLNKLRPDYTKLNITFHDLTKRLNNVDIMTADLSHTMLHEILKI